MPLAGSAHHRDSVSEGCGFRGFVMVSRRWFTSSLSLLAVVLAAAALSAPSKASGPSSVTVTTSHGRWVRVDDLPAPQVGSTLVQLHDGRVLAVENGSVDTGWCHRHVALFDPRTNTWSPAAPLHQHHCMGSTTLLPGGRVLVVGGHYFVTGVVHRTAELYHPATDQWTFARSMRHVRSSPVSVPLRHGRVLVVGSSRRPTAPAEIYHPRNDTWHSTPALPIAMEWGHGVRLRNGDVLVVASPIRRSTSPAARYDVSRRRWVPAGSFHGGWSAALFLRRTGNVLAVPSGNGPTHVYNPHRNHWREGPRMRGRMTTSAVVSVHGRPLALRSTVECPAPGSDAAGFLLLPRQHAWQRWTTMPYTPASFAAVRLRDGSVLVAGSYTIDMCMTGAVPEFVTDSYRYFPGD
jgi:hypothetical protein